jgi:hypothetical protein
MSKESAITKAVKESFRKDKEAEIEKKALQEAKSVLQFISYGICNVGNNYYIAEIAFDPETKETKLIQLVVPEINSEAGVKLHLSKDLYMKGILL